MNQIRSQPAVRLTAVPAPRPGTVALPERAEASTDPPLSEPWPARALMLGGALAVLPVTVAAVAGAVTVIVVRDAVNALLGQPRAPHRSGCACRRCQGPGPGQGHLPRG